MRLEIKFVDRCDGNTGSTYDLAHICFDRLVAELSGKRITVYGSIGFSVLIGDTLFFDESGEHHQMFEYCYEHHQTEAMVSDGTNLLDTQPIFRKLLLRGIYAHISKNEILRRYADFMIEKTEANIEELQSRIESLLNYREKLFKYRG